MLHRYLEHFQAISETLSFLKASENLNISQPALSRSIKLLEEFLGVPLFYRKNKGVEITEYGEILYTQVCSMKNEFKYAVDEIDHVKNKSRKVLRIGSGLAWQYDVFPNAVKMYKELFPDVQIQILTGFSENLYDQLLESKFDIIFCDISRLESVPGIEYEKFMNVFFSFFAAWNHPVFTKKPICEKDLMNYDIAVFSHSNLSSMYDMADDHQLSTYYRKNVKYISGSMINLMEVVSKSLYITSLPQIIHHIAEQFGLKEIHPDMRRSAFPSGMVYHRTSLEKPHVRAYIEAIRASISQ